MPPETTRQDFLGKSVPSRSLRDQAELDFGPKGAAAYDVLVNMGNAATEALQKVGEMFSGATQGELRPTGVPQGLLDANPLGDPRFQGFEGGRDDRVPLFQGPQNAQPEGFTGQSGAGPATLFGGAPGGQPPAPAPRPPGQFTEFDPGGGQPAAAGQPTGVNPDAGRLPPLPVSRAAQVDALSPSGQISQADGSRPPGPVNFSPLGAASGGGGGFSLPDDVISRLANSNIFGSLGVGMRTPGFLNGAAKATQLMAATRQKNRTQDIAQGAVDARSAATASTAETARLGRANKRFIQQMKNDTESNPTAVSLNNDQMVAQFGDNWPAIPEARAAYKELTKTTPARKNSIGILLADGRSGISDDGGFSMRDPTTGRPMRVPPDANLTGEAGLQQALLEKQRAAARQPPPVGGGGTSVPRATDASRTTAALGTGPYASTKAFIDAAVGGIFDTETMAPKTQNARQKLRFIRQTGIKALMTSARGSNYERELIRPLFPDPDTFFSNPQTESGKLDVAVQNLTQHRKLNDDLIVDSATSPKEVTKLRESNRDIDLTLEKIRTLGDDVMGSGASGVTPTGLPFTVQK